MLLDGYLLQFGINYVIIRKFVPGIVILVLRIRESNTTVVVVDDS